MNGQSAQTGVNHMFGHNLGLHVIKFPSGRYGFVGSIPTSLGEEILASSAAVMGQRSHWNADKTALLEWKFPVFDSEQEAKDFAASKGCAL
jgi:hypothetical protein